MGMYGSEYSDRKFLSGDIRPVVPQEKSVAIKPHEKA